MLFGEFVRGVICKRVNLATDLWPTRQVYIFVSKKDNNTSYLPNVSNRKSSQTWTFCIACLPYPVSIFHFPFHQLSIRYHSLDRMEGDGFRLFEGNEFIFSSHKYNRSSKMSTRLYHDSRNKQRPWNNSRWAIGKNN